MFLVHLERILLLTSGDGFTKYMMPVKQHNIVDEKETKMSNALKGILLSAFIFPGAGQIILARYGRGALFFVFSFISALLCITAIVRQAVVILQQLAAQGEAVTLPTIMTIAAKASTTGSTLFLKLSFFVFFCCWLFAVIDAWRIGKELDRKQEMQNNGQGTVA